MGGASPSARTLRPWQLSADACLALVVGLAAAGTGRWLGVEPPPAPWWWLEVALPAGVAIRRRLPTSAFALVTALLVIQVAALGQVLLVDVVLLICLHAVVSRSSAAAGALAVAVCVVGCLVTAALPAGRLPIDGDLRAAAITAGFLGALVAATTAGGVVARQRIDRVVALRLRAERLEQERARELALAAERERSRIARDVHDVVGHSLAVIVAQAQSGRFVAAEDPARASVALDAIAGTARAALHDVRQVLSVLRRPPQAEDMEMLIARARATGLQVRHRELGAAPTAVDTHVAETAYRVLQEVLTNAIKHADPSTSIDVEVAWEASQVRIEVADHGRGGSSSMAPGGAGLDGMRSRVDELGGQAVAGPGPGGGWVVAVTIPLGSR